MPGMSVTRDGFGVIFDVGVDTRKGRGVSFLCSVTNIDSLSTPVLDKQGSKTFGLLHLKPSA